VAVGTVKKSIETDSLTFFCKKVLKVWEGGLLCFGSNRETVRSEMSIPNFSNSP
jgi:hypothetical protein